MENSAEVKLSTLEYFSDLSTGWTNFLKEKNTYTLFSFESKIE